MEKITNEDLKEMLMKSENKEASDVIVNDETGEVQWVKVENVENLEDSLEQDIDFNTIPEKVEATPYELSSLNPIGAPLYPQLTIFLSSFTIHAPT